MKKEKEILSKNEKWIFCISVDIQCLFSRYPYEFPLDSLVSSHLTKHGSRWIGYGKLGMGVCMGPCEVLAFHAGCVPT